MGSCRTFNYRLYPTSHQQGALVQLMDYQRELYNAALEERRGAWLWEGRSVSYVDQCRTLTELRGVRPEVLSCGVTVSRGTLKRLDRAFCAFYRRCRRGEKPGFPRFRSKTRWHSLQWEDRGGWRLLEEARRLRLQGIGQVKAHLHRPLRGVPKAITVRREGKKWWLSVRCVDVPDEPLAPTGREVGVDLGVVALVATSDEALVTNPRYLARTQDQLARAQREISRKRRGSKSRGRALERVQRLHRKVANQRKDLAHKVSRSLVNDYDLIVTEDLRVANMVRRPRPVPSGDGTFLPNGASAKAGLNRAISDAGWAQLTAMINYKAASAGRCHLVVDPAHTSQRCARCGHVEKENRLSQAVFTCRSCGHRAHADVNAARNILGAGRALRDLSLEGSN